MRLQERDLPAVALHAKALHGVNCGPVSFGSLIDQTFYYQQAKFPLIRLHDTNWPHPREVDYYTIFPDFDADPTDPASYFFQSTDRYIRECMDTGASILFRLGVSIEHAADKYHIHPPRDFDRFVEICLGIVRHYTEGWADGFTDAPIRYWEIWNEPDLQTAFGYTDRPSPTWSGSFEEFCALYHKTASRLKAYNPNLCVGGPALAHADSSFARRFLNYIENASAPLDFLSWHIYTSSISRVRTLARALRAQLDAMGYAQTKILLDEWDIVFSDKNTEKIFKPNAHAQRGEAFTQMMQEQGAAFDAALLTALQAEPIDEAAFFCASPNNLYSMFDFYGRPQKNYYAFRQFSEAIQLGTVTALETPQRTAGLYVMRTEGDGKIALLLSNFSPEPASFEAIPRDGWESSVILTDARHTYAHQSLPEKNALVIPPYSVTSINYWRSQKEEPL